MTELQYAKSIHELGPKFIKLVADAAAEMNHNGATIGAVGSDEYDSRLGQLVRAKIEAYGDRLAKKEHNDDSEG